MTKGFGLGVVSQVTDGLRLLVRVTLALAKAVWTSFGILRVFLIVDLEPAFAT